MRNVDYWQRRLDVAVREAEDADRVWRQHMRLLGDAAHDPCGDVLWQERENAQGRAEQLRVLVETARSRRSRVARLRERLRQHAAFVAWHARTHIAR